MCVCLCVRGLSGGVCVDGCKHQSMQACVYAYGVYNRVCICLYASSVFGVCKCLYVCGVIKGREHFVNGQTD